MTLVGTTTIDATSLDLAGATLAGHLLITRDAATPAGDPVVVNLATLIDTAALVSVTVSNGATAMLSRGVSAISGATSLVIDGGVLEIGGSALPTGAPTTVTVHPAGGELRIESSGLPLCAVNLSVQFSAGAAPANFALDFPGATSVTAAYDPIALRTMIGDGISAFGGIAAFGRTVTLAGNPFGITAKEGATGTKAFSKPQGSAGSLTCFLPGAMIATPEGERAVEALQAGDAVLAVEHGRQVIRRLIWTGNQPIVVPDDRSAAELLPVRIRRHALAEDVPHTDLLVTPEHGLLMDGRLVPARMLVNGRSILIETEMRRYTAHHVETEPHAIIIANGLLTESYLDAGARSRRSGVVVRLPTTGESQMGDPPAQLEVSRDVVEPLWQAIADRAERLGMPATLTAATLTDDPNLRLVNENGCEILPLCVHDGRAIFLVPGTLGAAWLRSRSARPCDVIGPFVDDRRELGLLVGEVAVWQLESRRLLRHHLAIKTLSGWHAPEAAHCRWTDGNALLPLAPDPEAATLLVEVQILGGGPYLVAEFGAVVALADAA